MELIAGLIVGAFVGAGIASLLAGRNSTRLKIDLERQTAVLSERDREVEQLKQELPDRLRAISNEVLSGTSEQLQQGMQAQAVVPMSRELEKVKQKLEAVEQQRREAQGALTAQLETLGGQTDRLAKGAGDLATALSNPVERGKLGEIHLRNVIEAAGLEERSDFDDQGSLAKKSGEGQRPDVIVWMPGGGAIVIDAKFPMTAFNEALSVTEDDQLKKQLLEKHANEVRARVDELSKRNYPETLVLESQDSRVAVDFVVMFIPSDGVYQAAQENYGDKGIKNGQTLHDYAMSRNVVITTPTTLIGLLKAVDLGWQQETVAKSAKEIVSAGQEFYSAASTFLEPFAKLGRSIKTVVNDYDRAVGSYQGNLKRQLDKLRTARVEVPGKNHEDEDPGPVDPDAEVSGTLESRLTQLDRVAEGYEAKGNGGTAAAAETEPSESGEG